MRGTFPGAGSAAALLLSALLALAQGAAPLPPPTRPPAIVGAGPDDVVRYFAFGSNMLRSKLTNRGMDGKEIQILRMEPAVVYDHRLAFNLRGFPPLEPSMAALEPEAGAACEGALVEMRASEYERVWRSEGGAMARPPYEEIMVQAFPLGSGKQERPSAPAGVQAVTLRAVEEFRLACDAPPSERYKGLLLAGAKELGLSPDYITRLEGLQAARVAAVPAALAKANAVVGFAIFRAGPRWRWVLAPQRWLLGHLSTPSRNPVAELGRQVALSAVLLPGAGVGVVLKGLLKALGKKVSFGPPGAPSKPKPAPRAAADAESTAPHLPQSSAPQPAFVPSVFRRGAGAAGAVGGRRSAGGAEAGGPAALGSEGGTLLPLLGALAAGLSCRSRARRPRWALPGSQ